jgi:hypothetical protein
MLTEIKKAVFSLSGLSIGLGALGFLSGLVQLFVDVSSAISIKWVLLMLLLSLSLVLILLKVIFDLHVQKNAQPNYESPIRFLDKDGILVIRKNEHFVNQIIVGCYYITDEVERLAYVGVVHHVQEKVIQIRIIRSFLPTENGITPPININHLIIRPVVPYSALERLGSLEQEDGR